MKKSILFLAVVVGGMASTTYAADKTNLYGSVKFVLTDGTKTKNDDVNFDLSRSSSFGIRGNESLSNGLQAYFKLDLKVSDKGIGQTNDMYLGFKGSFGDLTLGRQKTLWGNYVNYADIFNSVFYKGSHGNSGRVSKVVKYVSPSMGGFTLGGSIVLDGDGSVFKTSDSKGVDAWDVGAQYNANGIKASATYYVQDQGNGTRELIGASGGYSNKNFKIGGGYAHESSSYDYYTLSGQYVFNSNTIRAGLGYKDQPNTKQGDFLEYALGYQYNLSDRTYAWVEADYKDFRASGKDDERRFLIGIKHNF